MRVRMGIGYMVGHLLYGHLEGVVNLTEKEEKEFRILLDKEFNVEELTSEEQDLLDDYKERVLEQCKIVVDDYELYDYGDFSWEDLLD